MNGAQKTQIGSQLLSAALNTVAPGLGTVASSMIRYKPPRPPEDLGEAPDTSKLQRITSFAPVTNAPAHLSNHIPGAAEARRDSWKDIGTSRYKKPIAGTSKYIAIAEDGTRHEIDDMGTINSAMKQFAHQSDTYYDPETGRMSFIPKEGHNMDFSSIDPRTGRPAPGRLGLVLSSGTNSIGEYSSPVGGNIPTGNNQPFTSRTPDHRAGEVTQRNTSPVSGSRLGNVYLPELTYNKI